MARNEQRRPQPTQSWSPTSLIQALAAAHAGDRTAAMKKAGVLTKSGKLAKTYRRWGKRKVAVTSAPAGPKPASKP